MARRAIVDGRLPAGVRVNEVHLAAALGVTSDDEDPVFTASATFLQGLIFIGTAVLFASFTRRPRPERRARAPTRTRPNSAPPHLHMNFRVIEEDGRQVGMGRNLAELKAKLTEPGLTAAVSGREKTPYSIRRKMQN